MGGNCRATSEPKVGSDVANERGHDYEAASDTNAPQSVQEDAVETFPPRQPARHRPKDSAKYVRSAMMSRPLLTLARCGCDEDNDNGVRKDHEEHGDQR